MSIKKNNVQIAGNYINFNVELLNDEITKLTNLFNLTKELVYTLGTPVGSERIWRGDTIPENWQEYYLIMEGQTVPREEYSQLYNWVVQNNLIVSDDEWNTNQMYGLYSYGDGTSTFRLPDMKGYYLVGYDPSYHTSLCQYQEDTIRNITGTLDIRGDTPNSTPFSNTQVSGAFIKNAKTTTSYSIAGNTTSQDGNVENIEFDASKVVPTGDRVQPKSIPVKYLVCCKDIRVDAIFDNAPSF